MLYRVWQPLLGSAPVGAAGVARAALHGWAESRLVLPTDLQYNKCPRGEPVQGIHGLAGDG